MKIYFDGCSWTQGGELENPEKERFSKLICDKLGAEETNLAIGGGSNDRIVRNLLVEHHIKDYDLAMIQMTSPIRTEYLRVDKWRQFKTDWKLSRMVRGDKELEFGADKKLESADGHEKFLKHYYNNIANLRYFETKEKIHRETIISYSKANNVPLILSTINRFSNLDFDYVMKVEKATSAPRKHPNKQGHKIIANDLLKHYENLF